MIGYRKLLVSCESNHFLCVTHFDFGRTAGPITIGQNRPIVYIKVANSLTVLANLTPRELGQW